MTREDVIMYELSLSNFKFADIDNVDCNVAEALGVDEAMLHNTVNLLNRLEDDFKVPGFCKTKSRAIQLFHSRFTKDELAVAVAMIRKDVDDYIERIKCLELKTELMKMKYALLEAQLAEAKENKGTDNLTSFCRDN